MGKITNMGRPSPMFALAVASIDVLNAYDYNTGDIAIMVASGQYTEQEILDEIVCLLEDLSARAIVGTYVSG